MKKYIVASVVALTVALVGAASVNAAFMTNLTVGSTGADVSALQSWLISKGFAIPSISSGAATPGYFGQQTKTAVIAYQASVGLPTTGYVGPLTRGILNSGGVATAPVAVGCPVGYDCTPKPGTTPTTPITVSGGEGQLTDFEEIGSISGESVDESENNAKVLGIEVEAEDSDMKIERIDVDFTAPGTGSDNLDDYIESVSIWNGSTKLATLDVSKADDSETDIFSFRFTGLNSVIKEGDVASIYVAVDAVSNVDSSDTGSWTVEIPLNGVRAVDGAGISDTYVVDADNLSETFTVGDANTGELDVTEASSNPTSGIVTVSDENDTSDVVLLAIDLEADESDLIIDEIPFSLTATGATAAEIVKSVQLVKGSTVLKSKSLTSGQTYVLFENINLSLEEGDTETLKLVATINDLEGSFTEGDSVYATATSSTAWDVEDANGDSVTPDGDVTGDAQTFYLDGIIVTQTSAPTATANDGGVATFEIPFTVKANGSDIYISTNSPDATTTAVTAGTGIGAQYATSTTASGLGVVSSDDLLVTYMNGDSLGTYAKIGKGTSRTFKLQVVMSNTSTTTLAKDLISLASINWGTTTSAISQHYTYNLGSYVTDPLSWKTAP